MNCSDIEESFDSLWFFCNVVSSLRTEQSTAHAVNVDAVKEEAPKLENQIEEEKQYESPSSENLVSKSPKCREFSKDKAGEFANTEEGKKSNSSRRRRSTKRSKRSLRKILGELDRLHLGFNFVTSERHYQVLGSGIEYHHPMNMKMPPLDDNVAMKEHLKSWAYAVACTVK